MINMKFKSNAKYNMPVESGTIYETKVSDMRVCIHKIIRLEGWFLNCDKLGIMDKELRSQEFNECVKESKEIIKKKMDELSKSVKMFCDDDDIEITK